ncbi:Choline transporter-like protein [Quillaja saponaria]|uniref:Choline transporter-like protein n=1 Tax=Quillaja saponaria TaxID=32244 RepID=A0AAD7Q7Y0_QUISA|nr:Choline transporter-like protein [Quillaja saponaria]
METLKSSDINPTRQNTHIKVEEHRPPFINPVSKAQEPNFPIRTTVVGQISKKLFEILFYLHLILIAILIVFFTIHGILFANRTHLFQPLKWYPPLLTSTACAGIVAFIWQRVTVCNTSKAIRAAFWLSPLLTCAVGVLFFYIGSAGSLAAAAVAGVSVITQSLYGRWVSPRFGYATRVLSVSVANPPSKTMVLTFSSIFTSILYSCFVISGIGGVTAERTKLGVLFILVFLLSLAWTMQVMKNVVQVMISQVKYMQFSSETDTRVAFHDTIKHLMGSVCIGSILVPILGLIRGSARAMSQVAGDTDEFLFSCANCYKGVASILITYGNRWGFVYVGVYNKGFVQASSDTWEMFRRVGLEELIDSDLTGSFCFLCGVTGGAISSLLSGIWTLAVHKSYATELSVYGFFIGYFMTRLAMAWPQACVSAYYVAYAENPQSAQFDSTIPVRLEELQRSQA